MSGYDKVYGTQPPPSLDCWDYTIELECLQGTQDLQLAAELGKTLLERNKELETTVRQNQTIIDDQAQEIEYLTKQTAALREVNDSRLRIYEQLEVSILELERNNQRLTLDAAADKKHIKTLCVSIDQLESRYEELQRKYQDAIAETEKQKRQVGVPSTTEPPSSQQVNAEELDRLRGELQEARNQNLRDQRRITKLEEQVAALVQENAVLEEQLGEYGRKEDELRSLQEEISILEDVRNGQACLRCARGLSSGIHQYGGSADYAYSDAGTDGGLADPEEDVATNGDAPIEQGTNASSNPYRDLVQKYEALVQIQPHSVVRCHPRQNVPGPTVAKATSPAVSAAGNEPRSLQEELAMSGDFSSFRNEDSDSGDETPAGHQAIKTAEKTAPPQTGNPTPAPVRNRPNKIPATSTPTPTPTDFSEAETSSSGFSDETSNKATQTEAQHQIAAACASAALAASAASAVKGAPQGSFLCTITDGDDCRFSIYDEASSVESRFRKAPEYRTLFREIFGVLKRAAEAKDEGEKLPLLEDERRNAPKNPPSTPAREDLPLLTLADGTGASVISEEPSEVCSSNGDVLAAAAECLAAVAAAAATPQDTSSNVEKPSVETTLEKPAPATPTPKRDIMEYLAMGLGPKKKSHSRKNSPHPSPRRGEDACPSPPPVVGARRVTYGRAGGRRKRDRAASPASPASPGSPASRTQPSASSFSGPSNAAAASSLAARCHQELVSSPGSSKPTASPSANPPATAVWTGRVPSFEVKRPFASAASKEVAKLKRLEETYADVLRRKPEGLHRKK